ncbi:hypothetical protein [Catenibacillus scindens]|uniref:hypothetical protein n=1 Tax=Catenibacillus scindens TaxID=673271 RepID=UPI003208CF5A
MEENMTLSGMESPECKVGKKFFGISFATFLLLFALVEIFCFYLPEQREIKRFEEDVKNDLQTAVGEIFTWMEELQDYMGSSDSFSQEDIQNYLFDGTGMFQGPWSIKGILYASDSNDSYGYWNLESDMEDSFILDYVTDYRQNANDGQRWIQLDGDDVQSMYINIAAALYVSDDIQFARTNMEPALCGVGSVHAGNGFKGFVAYVPLEGTDEALMAVIEEKALTNRPVFQSLTGKGYGYTLSKDASSFSVALATGPDFMAREKGDYEIELPGCIWNLNIYPLKGVFSLYRILLEVGISVLGAWVIACKMAKNIRPARN